MNTETAGQALSVAAAVRAAVRALPSFLGHEGKVEGLRVEEVFPPAEEAPNWRITLSHLEPGVERPKREMTRMVERAMGAVTPPPPPERVYKVLHVHPASGEVLRMSLRDNPGASSG